MKKIKTYSRRDFLRLTGLGVAGSLVAGCSGLPLAMPDNGATDVGVPLNGTSGNIPVPGPNNAGIANLTPNLAGEKNILLIIADDMGADKTSYNYGTAENKIYLYDEAEQSDITEDTLPEMQTVKKLADNGILFENTWAQPTCTPTRSTLFTGTHPFVSGGGSPQTPGQFEPTGDTLPQMLKKAGYVNAIFGKWHLGDEEGQLPLDRGWDHHVGIWGGGVGGYAKKVNPKISRVYWPKVRNKVKVEGNGDLFTDWDLTHEAYHWIKDHKDQRWSATMAYLLPHDPYDQPPTDVADITVPLGTADKAVVNAGFYDEEDSENPYYKENAKSSKIMAQYLDKLIDTLLTELDNLGVLKDTLIFFIGDNGTHETAFSPAIPETITGPLDFKKKGSVLLGGVRVPFIVADGNDISTNPEPNNSYIVNGTGRRIPDHAHVVDLYQTIAIAAGANADDGIHSKDLTPYLKDQTHPAPRQENFSQYFGDTQGIQATIIDENNQYKLNYQNGCYQLYDIKADPANREGDNLFDSTDPAIVAVREDLMARLKNNYAPTSRRRSKFPDCSICDTPAQSKSANTECNPQRAKINPVRLIDFL